MPRTSNGSGARAGFAFALLTAITMAVPADAQAPAQVALAQVTVHRIPSTVLDETRTVYVRTPPGFTKGRRYPVLYLTDADAQFAHTATTVEFLARQGRIPDMLVVGVTNTNRTRDLTPTEGRLGPNGQRAGGGADRFLDFFERELVPFVESQYSAFPYRLFAGHSLGGMFAVHAMLTRPALFHGVVAVSPALHWDEHVVLERARKEMPSGVGAARVLVVTLGHEPAEITSAFDAFEDVLQRSAPKTLAWTARRFGDEDHGSVVLPSHYFGLREIFKNWPLRVDRDDTACSVEQIVEHYAKASARLGWEALPPPEAALNLAGYRCMAAGRHADALLAFERNVALYPESANVYDSLGEGLEAAGKLDAAIVQYRKAVEIAGTQATPLEGVFRQHLEAARAKAAARTP